MILRGETRITKKKNPAAQISHGLTWDQTGVSTVRGRRQQPEQWHGLAPYITSWHGQEQFYPYRVVNNTLLGYKNQLVKSCLGKQWLFVPRSV
jgi:hypothetical protein